MHLKMEEIAVKESNVGERENFEVIGGMLYGENV